MSRALGRPLRTIQRACHRLAFLGDAVSQSGRWVLKSLRFDISADPGASLGFQNLLLDVSKWRVDPVPPCRTARDWRAVPGGDAGACEGCELAWEGRQVTLRYYPGRESVQLFLRAKEPVPWNQAGHFYGWVAAMLGLGRGEKVTVARIEINADHAAIRLEQNYLEFRDLARVLQVLYQKASALRHEIRLHRPEDRGQDLPFHRAMEMLVEGSAESRALKLVREEIRLERMRTRREKVARAAPEGAAPGRRDPAQLAPSDALREGFG